MDSFEVINGRGIVSRKSDKGIEVAGMGFKRYMGCDPKLLATVPEVGTVVDFQAELREFKGALQYGSLKAIRAADASAKRAA